MLKPKIYAVLHHPGSGLWLSFSGGLKCSRTPIKATATADSASGNLDEWDAGIEYKFAGIPTGFVSQQRLDVLFPFVTGRIKIGDYLHTNQAWVCYSSDGTAETFYNMEVTKEPTLTLGIGVSNPFSEVELVAVRAKTGEHAGHVKGLAAVMEMPTDDEILPVTTLFHASPAVSWFADRATGAAAATGSIDLDGTNFVEGQTVTVGPMVYKMTAEPGVANDVLLDANLALSMTHLKDAIMRTGIPGNDYWQTTPRHPLVNATCTTTALNVTARVKGTKANALAFATSVVPDYISGATLTGGTDPWAAANAVAYHVGATGLKGWYDLETAGLKLTPTSKIDQRKSDQMGVYGYVLDNQNASVTFLPLDLDIECFRAVDNPDSLGSSLAKGDVVVQAGDLTAILSRGSFAGGDNTYSREADWMNALTISANFARENGVDIPSLELRWAGA